jgi:hypothetical protein
MSTTTLERPPAEPEAWCWAITGHYDAACDSVQPAQDRSRGQAAARYADEIGERFIDVAVWRRYARAMTVDEQWDYYRNRLDVALPDEPRPEGWRPDPWDEDMPVWEFCHADDEGAVPVWICAPRGTSPPPTRATDNKED